GTFAIFPRSWGIHLSYSPKTDSRQKAQPSSTPPQRLESDTIGELCTACGSYHLRGRPGDRIEPRILPPRSISRPGNPKRVHKRHGQDLAQRRQDHTEEGRGYRQRQDIQQEISYAY